MKSQSVAERRVPFLDLTRLHSSIHDELIGAVEEALSTSRLVGAEACRRFESAFAAAHGARFAVGCGSGTDALVLALRAGGIGPGDEVIVPAMTFVATAEAVLMAGAIPVLADVDPVTLLLSEPSVAEVRSARTRAVVPVHLYGHCVPFATMEAWRETGLMVVEDAAQAHLATWEGRSVGQVGRAACFSFYPGKNLGALGDGGLVLTDDEELARSVASLRDHGSNVRYRHDEPGMCSRLDGIQAAVLAVKLDHLPEWTASRRRLAERYGRRLAGDGPRRARLVPWQPGAVHHLLVVRIADGARPAVEAALAERGIGTGVHYPLALSEQPALAPWARPCPSAERAASEVLSLPMDPLMTDDDVDRVCDALGSLP